MDDINSHHFEIYPDEQLYFKFLTHEENSPKQSKVEQFQFHFHFF